MESNYVLNAIIHVYNVLIMIHVLIVIIYYQDIIHLDLIVNAI